MAPYDDDSALPPRMTIRTRHQVEQLVRDVLATYVGIEPSEVPDKFAETLGFDSVDLIEVWFTIEERLGQEIPFLGDDDDQLQLSVAALTSLVADALAVSFPNDEPR